MTRNFLSDAVPDDVVDTIVDLARRSPSAGNTRAVEFLVLTGDAVVAYWELTLPEERRAGFPWPGLLLAPVLVLPWVEPDAYRRRYAEGDKAHTGLGSGVDAWATPYWWVDGGMAAMAILLAAADAGLGALFFGVFDHEDAVRGRFGVPHGRRVVGAVALGWPAPEQRASLSARRSGPALAEVVHRDRWRSSDPSDSGVGGAVAIG